LREIRPLASWLVPAVVVESLTVRYGDRVAVDGLSFDAEAGQVLTVLGPNGAGKTSTIEALEGYRRPASGTLRVLGLDPDWDHAALTQRMGVMLQHGGVHPALRPPEVLRQHAAFYASALDPAELLERVGLVDQRGTAYRRLSGGEQQRLSLALALIGRPSVVFLDEPTAGIDPAGRQVIRRIITELRDDGVCVVVTTHDLDEAERVADQVVIIDGGRLVGSGTPAELMASGGGEEIRFGAPAGLAVGDLASTMGAEVTEAQPGEYVVATEATPAAVAALTAWLADRDLPLSDLRAGRQRLEDVFLRLTEPESHPTSELEEPP
jgi:ABC-2 type transport system ATP-binding protein